MLFEIETFNNIVKSERGLSIKTYIYTMICQLYLFISDYQKEIYTFTLKIKKCHAFCIWQICLSSNYKMVLKGNRVFSVGFPRNRLWDNIFDSSEGVSTRVGKEDKKDKKANLAH